MGFWTTRAERLAKAGDLAALVHLLDGSAEPAHERAGAACAFVELGASLGTLRAQVVASLLRLKAWVAHRLHSKRANRSRSCPASNRKQKFSGA